MKRILTILAILTACCTLHAQERKAQNKPYIDLRPLHFGIIVGTHLQDIEFENVGPRLVTADDGTTAEQYVLCDADKWSPGISVGILADLRLNNHFSFRVAPTMHFGAKHLRFRNLNEVDERGYVMEKTQDLKNTYIAVPLDIKFSAQRFNNYRPYMIAGISPMVNLSGNDQDFLRLKRSDLMIEVGLGCDFYLPYIKLIPELKFCFGLGNCLDKNHAAELQDANMRAYANSVSRATSKMIVLSFNFE